MASASGLLYNGPPWWPKGVSVGGDVPPPAQSAGS